MRQEKSSLLRNKGFQSLLASLLCIVLGLLIGYIVLLIINPAGAGEAIRTIVENFLYYPSAAARLRYLGNTLVKTAPLLMCSLSVLFAYKVGLFNIGAAGQYVIGAGASLYCALGFGLPWYVCLLAAIAAGAVLGAISGLLKAYRNVNEVISCIMLNWISLYLERPAVPGEGDSQSLHLHPEQHESRRHPALSGPGRPVLRQPVCDHRHPPDGDRGRGHLGPAGEDQAGL